MKSVLFCLILFALTSCRDSTVQKTNPIAPAAGADTAKPTLIKSRYTDSLNDAAVKYNKRYIDSAGFDIFREDYISGTLHMETYRNRQTNLDTLREFYETGRLKKEEIKTTKNHLPIGKWKYYSTAGVADSIIDHDKKYNFSYFKAMRIAGKHGYGGNDIEIAMQYGNVSPIDDKHIYWCFIRWAADKTGDGETGDAILVDTQTGRVSKSVHLYTRSY